MEKREIVDRLRKLVQLDIDASHAYAQAIEKIDHPSVRDKLGVFRGDHERHVAELSAMIIDFGGEAPEYGRDFKGFLIEGFTSLRSITGTKGALHAMQTNEKMTNRRYEDALGLEFPHDVHSLLERNFQDEKTHLEYIERAIEARLWE